MLRFKPTISRRNAHEMIMLFAKHGNHYHGTDFQSDADIKRAFVRNGIDYEALVNQCRNFQINVPFFENLVGSTISTSGNGSLARVDITGAVDFETQGPGSLVLYAYWARFEAAVGARDRAVSDSSYPEFQNAVVEGIASIEGYIQLNVERWNKNHPQQLLLDTAEKKIPFDEKITKWIPIITAGEKFDRGGIEWKDFVALRQIRDNLVVHPKTSSFGISFPKLAEQINLFRTGIAQTLINLHLLFNDKIPAIIIRAAYAPDVEYITE
jgi:hypothetical protein